jgi:hypothetical protein
MTTSEVFEKVLERPPMYVGHCSAIRILIFLEGYRYALLQAGTDPRDELYDGFQGWVAKRFDIKTMHDWASIISFMSQSELAAFEMTKDLWRKYKSEYEEAKDAKK